MNLALLNPFRQADRIDSTLTIPRALHPPRPKKDDASSSSKTTVSNNDDAAAAAAAKSDEKNKPVPTSSESPFKIPKKQKLNNGSTKLFRQSLKLPKLSKGENGSDATKSKEGESASCSSQSKAMEVDHNIDSTDNKTNKNLEDDKDSMMDIETGGAKDKSRDGKEDDNEVTPKQKKKRKKKGSQKQSSSKDNASSEEDDDDDDESENYWTACYAVSFNRRGSNLASGHASGLIPIHDFSGRTMSALYWPPPGINLAKGKNNASVSLQSFVYSDGGSRGKDGGDGGNKRNEKENGKKKRGKLKKKKDTKGNKQEEKIVQISSDGDLLVGAASSKEESTAAAAPVDAATVISDKDASKDEPSDNQLQYMNGVTSLSWCRHSRTLLAGAIGDKNLRLMDNTHPLVSTDCTDAMRRLFLAESGSKDFIGDNETSFTLEEKKASIISMSPPVVTTLPSPPPDNNERPGDFSASSGKNSSSNEKNAGERITIRMETESLGRARLLRSNVVDTRNSKSSSSYFQSASAFSSKGCLSASTVSLSGVVPPQTDESTISIPTRRHPTLLLELPQPLGGPVQLHPRDSHAGLACMIDGSLALFWIPPMAFYETLHSSIGDGNETDNVYKETDTDDEQKKKWVMNLLKEEELSRVGNLAFLVPPPEKKLSTANQSSPQYFITCAAFGKQGDVLWAVTKCGNLLAFCIDQSMMNMLRGCGSSPAAVAFANQMVKPTLCVKVPGGAAAWQIIVSRNGKSLLINSADCSLRLYDVEELSEAFKPPSGEIKRKDGNYTRNADIAPSFVFQDNISKAPWASCDFSGDGEYVCGGCNSYPQPGDNYKIFLWNCITGELVDQLTGPVSSLYSLSCHPTRPFIAVGTSDGLVDVWGARLDWVAFAPDFQALQQNELYEEREDEFDVVVDGKGEDEDYGKEGWLSPEDDDVDIMTIDKVPAFDSDSEDESDVFHFNTKVDKIINEKQPGPKKAEHE